MLIVHCQLLSESYKDHELQFIDVSPLGISQSQQIYPEIFSLKLLQGIQT